MVIGAEQRNCSSQNVKIHAFACNSIETEGLYLPAQTPLSRIVAHVRTSPNGRFCRQGRQEGVPLYNNQVSVLFLGTIPPSLQNPPHKNAKDIIRMGTGNFSTSTSPVTIANSAKFSKEVHGLYLQGNPIEDPVPHVAKSRSRAVCQLAVHAACSVLNDGVQTSFIGNIRVNDSKVFTKMPYMRHVTEMLKY
jgi:hypothetical protein